MAVLGEMSNFLADSNKKNSRHYKNLPLAIVSVFSPRVGLLLSHLGNMLTGVGYQGDVITKEASVSRNIIRKIKDQ